MENIHALIVPLLIFILLIVTVYLLTIKNISFDKMSIWFLIFITPVIIIYEPRIILNLLTTIFNSTYDFLKSPGIHWLAILGISLWSIYYFILILINLILFVLRKKTFKELIDPDLWWKFNSKKK